MTWRCLNEASDGPRYHRRGSTRGHPRIVDPGAILAVAEGVIVKEVGMTWKELEVLLLKDLKAGIDGRVFNMASVKDLVLSAAIAHEKAKDEQA